MVQSKCNARSAFVRSLFLFYDSMRNSLHCLKYILHQLLELITESLGKWLSYVVTNMCDTCIITLELIRLKIVENSDRKAMMVYTQMMVCALFCQRKNRNSMIEMLNSKPKMEMKFYTVNSALAYRWQRLSHSCAIVISDKSRN